MLYNIYDRIIINNQVDITITNYSNVNIESDIEKLTDRCTITVPIKNLVLGKDPNTKNLRLLQNNSEEQFNITIGNKVTVYFNYYKDTQQLQTIIDDKEYLKSIFIGYVSTFNYNEDSIDIVCEDSNWLFKQKRLKNSWTITNKDGKQTTPKLLDVIKYIKDNTPNTSDVNLNRVQDIEIGKFRVNDPSTGAEIFNKLKDEYSIHIYFTNEWDEATNKMIVYLNAGLKYRLENTDFQTKAIYQYPYNDLYYPIISKSLVFNTFNKERDLAVIGTSYIQNKDESYKYATKDGIKGTIETLDKKDKTVGENQLLKEIEDRPTRIELNIPNLTISPFSATNEYSGSLAEMVNRTWLNFPTEGYEGSFETFVKPIIRIGDIIDIRIADGLTENPASELHYVDEVSISLSANTGLIQTITLGTKIS